MSYYLRVAFVVAALLHVASASPIYNQRRISTPTCTLTDPSVYSTPALTVRARTTTAPIETGTLNKRGNTYVFGMTNDITNIVVHNPPAQPTRTGIAAPKSWPDEYTWPFPWSEIKAITKEIYLTHHKITPILESLKKLHDDYIHRNDKLLSIRANDLALPISEPTSLDLSTLDWITKHYSETLPTHTAWFVPKTTTTWWHSANHADFKSHFPWSSYIYESAFTESLPIGRTLLDEEWKKTWTATTRLVSHTLVETSWGKTWTFTSPSLTFDDPERTSHRMITPTSQVSVAMTGPDEFGIFPPNFPRPRNVTGTVSSSYARGPMSAMVSETSKIEVRAEVEVDPNSYIGKMGLELDNIAIALTIGGQHIDEHFNITQPEMVMKAGYELVQDASSVLEILREISSMLSILQKDVPFDPPWLQKRLDTLWMAASDFFGPFKRYDDRVFESRSEGVFHPAMREQRIQFAGLMQLWRAG